MSGTRELEAPTPDALKTRQSMVDEARQVIDAARECGVVLRLIGGLAVREHCEVFAFCERDYSDIDLVGRRADYGDIAGVFRQLGYLENHGVRFATQSRQLQFYRECRHPDDTLHYFIHADDHVDVFLDTFRMDHDIRLADRLDIERYTISLTDLLLTKLQITRFTEKDVRDAVVLLKDVPLADDDRLGAINAAHIARLAAEDWGLNRDVTVMLAAAAEAPAVYDLSAAERERVAAAVETLTAAIAAAPKSRRWRRRAKVGERRSWSNLVEEQDGAEHGPPLAAQPR